MTPSGRVAVRVPATSANLGPGFDALALALARYDDVVVEVTGGGLDVEVTGVGARELPRDERHLVVRAARAAFDLLGGQPPGLALRCRNRIPHARGLGSSAAAIVAGATAARALVPDGALRLDDAALLALCARLEGHPDNVAACLLGGLTIAWTEASGARAVRLPVAAALRPVVLVPESTAATDETRRLLPSAVPHADAAANAARAALLVEALQRRPDLLLSATEDRLHQAYRAPAMPETADLVAVLRARGLPAVVSGAGPSVLVLDLPRGAGAPVGLGTTPRSWTLCETGVDLDGAMVRSDS